MCLRRPYRCNTQWKTICFLQTTCPRIEPLSAAIDLNKKICGPRINEISIQKWTPKQNVSIVLHLYVRRCSIQSRGFTEVDAVSTFPCASLSARHNFTVASSFRVWLAEAFSYSLWLAVAFSYSVWLAVAFNYSVWLRCSFQL